MRRGLVSEVFVTEAARARFGSLLTDAQVHLVTERAAKALSDTVTPVGLVAVCSVPEIALDDVLAESPRLLAVAAEISPRIFSASARVETTGRVRRMRLVVMGVVFGF